jgi:hypothetical protein
MYRKPGVPQQIFMTPRTPALRGAMLSEPLSIHETFSHNVLETNRIGYLGID